MIRKIQRENYKYRRCKSENTGKNGYNIFIFLNP